MYSSIAALWSSARADRHSEITPEPDSHGHVKNQLLPGNHEGFFWRTDVAGKIPPGGQR